MDIENLLPFLKLEFFGNTLMHYAIALTLFLFSWAILLVFRSIILRKLGVLAEKSLSKLDDIVILSLKELPKIFYFFIALFIGLFSLSLNSFVSAIFFILLFLFIIVFIQSIITNSINATRVLDARKRNGITLTGIKIILSIILWTSGLLLILSNLGVNVSALVASLGIGGIAVAFALQNILSDIFSSFSIFFDKPFEYGDFIVVGTEMGTVKKIGLKTTRIESIRGEEIVIPNKDLTEARILNFKKMDKRRIVFEIGVVYETSTKQLKKIPEIIKNILDTEEHAEYNRVHFKSFGDFSLNFEVVYYVDSNDYLVYMDTQQAINFAIKEAFEKEKIEMAFPTQTLYVNK